MRTRIMLVVAALMASVVPPAAAAARTTLTIIADLDDGQKAHKWTLTCEPSGGNHPNRKAACALLSRQGTKIFTPVPADAMCTEQYGGPERVRVVGKVRGKKVDALFIRTNGCQIARYNRAAPLFTIPGTSVVRGQITLDDQPASGTVIFLSGRRQIVATATAGAFVVRLTRGAWLGSASIGRSCIPVTLTIPIDINITDAPLPPVIACRSTSTG